MNWKEQFDNEFGIHFKNAPEESQFAKDFISAQIIEKLIYEMPSDEEYMASSHPKPLENFKQHLRDKWL